MGKRHKLAIVPEGQLKEDAKFKIRDFVVDRYLRGTETKLQDIQDEFGKSPYDLSEGCVINYLNELVDRRKLSTWKVKNFRFYGPPKIPLPIKVGLAISGFILGVSVLIDIFLPPEFVYTYIYLGLRGVDTNPEPQSTMMPLVVYMLGLTFILTLIWYISDRKTYK
jgi:hypothetical protein